MWGDSGFDSLFGDLSTKEGRRARAELYFTCCQLVKAGREYADLLRARKAA